jgi:hypothetical protein
MKATSRPQDDNDDEEQSATASIMEEKDRRSLYILYITAYIISVLLRNFYSIPFRIRYIV